MFCLLSFLRELAETWSSLLLDSPVTESLEKLLTDVKQIYKKIYVEINTSLTNTIKQFVFLYIFQRTIKFCEYLQYL